MTQPNVIAEEFSEVIDDLAEAYPAVGFVLLAVLEHGDGESSVVTVKNIDDEAFSAIAQRIADEHGESPTLDPTKLN